MSPVEEMVPKTLFRNTSGQTGGQIDRYTGRKADGPAVGWTDGQEQTDRCMDGRTDRQTDRQNNNNHNKSSECGLN